MGAGDGQADGQSSRVSEPMVTSNASKRDPDRERLGTLGAASLGSRVAASKASRPSVSKKSKSSKSRKLTSRPD